MKNIKWIVALIGISLTGCYTSFVPRDYEEDSFGQFDDNYYYDDTEDVALNADTSEFYYPEEFYYDDYNQGLTVINNYGTDWGWGYNSPFYSNHYTSYGYYDPFYDPYYNPYYYPYGPYYGSYYGYGGYYSGYGYYNYPSSVRYRTNRSHWTGLRNNGGRAVVTRSRDVNRGRAGDRETFVRDESRTIRGFDLDRDLQVSKIASNSRSSNKTGLRTAGYTRDSNSKVKAKRTTDLERRRISNQSKNKEVIRKSKVSNEKRTQRVTKKSRFVNNKNKSNSRRSIRVYSSNKVSKNKNSGRTSSRTYYKPPSRSSKKSKISKPSRGSNSNSSSYSSSRNKSRSSSSHSSVSRSSGSSSSRSSVSRSSSRSSSSPRSTSGRSSRRR